MTNDKMQLARGRLGLYAGVWLAMASKMQWLPGQPMGGVAMVDGRQVIYNRDNLNKRPLGEVVFIALHEIIHPMLCHLTRRGNRDPKIYGLAIDIIDNKLCVQVMNETPILKMQVPPDALFGSAFGLSDADITSVEEVYAKLLKKFKGKGKGKGPPEKGEGGNEPGDGPPMFDEHAPPKNEDGTEMTAAEREAEERDWKITVQAAADMAKKQGKLPGFMEQFINQLLKPKVDWRAQLWSATKIAKDDTSYRRFNRKHIHAGIYLPGNYSERIGEVAYVTDTSGSISTEEFKQALGEMNFLIEELKPEVLHFGQCDTRLVSMQQLTVDSLPLAVTVKGRGGTDMREAFEWAREHEDELDMFILQTDGYVPPLDPSLHPSCRVIIIVTTNATLPAGWEFDTIIRVEV
jgi:predicted metal-dependent peptidase